MGFVMAAVEKVLLGNGTHFTILELSRKIGYFLNSFKAMGLVAPIVPIGHAPELPTHRSRQPTSKAESSKRRCHPYNLPQKSAKNQKNLEETLEYPQFFRAKINGRQ